MKQLIWTILYFLQQKTQEAWTKIKTPEVLRPLIGMPVMMSVCVVILAAIIGIGYGLHWIHPEVLDYTLILILITGLSCALLKERADRWPGFRDFLKENWDRAKERAKLKSMPKCEECAQPKGMKEGPYCVTCGRVNGG